MIKREPESFYSWVFAQLNRNPEIGQNARDEIYQEIIDYVENAKTSQNVPYDSLIYSLGNKIQFVNSFLLKRGYAPLRSHRSPFKNFLVTILALSVILLVGGFGFYQYLKTQFDFNFDDGKITLFGQDLDVNQNDVRVDINDQFSTRFISKTFSLPADVNNIVFELGNTKTTITYNQDDRMTIDCRIPINDDFLSEQTGNTYNIANTGSSNCDFAIPASLAFELRFTNGRVSLDRPTSSFKIEGENGFLTWIKAPDIKYQMFFETNNQANLADFKDIFDENAPRKSEIKLNNATLNFID